MSKSTTVGRPELSQEDLDFIKRYEESEHDCHSAEEDGCEICDLYYLLVSRMN